MIDSSPHLMKQIQKQVLNNSDGIINSKELNSSNTYPDGFNFGKSTDDFSNDQYGYFEMVHQRK